MLETNGNGSWQEDGAKKNEFTALGKVQPEAGESIVYIGEDEKEHEIVATANDNFEFDSCQYIPANDSKKGKYIAKFKKINRSIKLDVDGNGTLESDPVGSADAGANVTLIVTPGEGCKLDKWDIDPSVEIKESETNKYTFIMPPEEINIKAFFVEKPDIKKLTINSGGVDYKYYPVFAEDSAPDGIDWYSGDTKVPNEINSMSDINLYNVDGYVASNGASFTAVRCVKELWGDAFGSSTMSGDFATNYSGSSIISGETCENVNDTFKCTDIDHSSTPIPKINNIPLTEIHAAYLFCDYDATFAEFWSCKKWNAYLSWVYSINNGDNTWWKCTPDDEKGILFSRTFS